MGRKGKKRGVVSTRTPNRTPVRTPTNLSAHEEQRPSEPLQPESYQQPSQPASHQQPSRPESCQQPSPPLSPEQLILHTQESPEVVTVSEQGPSLLDGDENMMRSVSPPQELDTPMGQRHNILHVVEPTSPITRQMSYQAYGPNPHVIACVSCNDVCVLTGPRGLVDRSKVAPGTSNNDRFFPIVCSKCEDERGTLWFRLESGRRLPHRGDQLPGTISTSMLAAWPLYHVTRRKFGAEFDAKVNAPTMAVSRAHDWWREGILTHEKTMFLRWWFDETLGALCEVQPHPRKDQFFGQPRVMHR